MKTPTWNVDLPYDKRLNQLAEELEAWIRLDTLCDLATAWGATPISTADTHQLFDWFDTFSAEHWDFRKGKERNLITAPPLPSQLEQLTLTAAEKLGLTHAAPPSRHKYEFGLILGGLIRACITRPRYAAELLDAGVQLGEISAIGAFRPLAGDELSIADNLNVDVDDEFSAMVAGCQHAFNGRAVRDIERSRDGGRSNHDWAIARLQGVPPVEIIAAPSSLPESRRATTADTFKWWAARQTALTGKHALVITAPIYLHYQGAAAIEILGMPFDVSVETVGISSTAGDLGSDTQLFSPTNYLQEIRSSIRGYASLYRDVVRRTRAG